MSPAKKAFIVLYLRLLTYNNIARRLKQPQL
jgi:hypothetical protein